MNEDTKRDRSPNFPKLTLEASIEFVRKLHKELGKAKVKRDVAIKALGYSGVNGASLTTLGALNQYGLIEQDRGAGVSITPLTISLLHPMDESQSREAKKTAALAPKVFNSLFTEGFHHASASTIANNLIQNGFTPDGASRAASVYLANISFANLLDDGINIPRDAKKEQVKSSLESGNLRLDPVKEILEMGRNRGNEARTDKKMLAQYSIPIGANEFTITVTGEKLVAEDFVVLKEYADLWKRQLERAAADLDTQLIIDVSRFETNEDGDYILPKFWDNKEGYEYLNLKTKEHIRAIGKRKSDGKILASTSCKFHGDPEFECLWIR